ncbi:MAG: hypothetical protein ACRD1Q_14365, partial [Vicinamibacterales bacterium]
IQRYEDKHFSGRRNGLNFKKYKAYRLLLYRNSERSTNGGRTPSLNETATSSAAFGSTRV